MVHRDTNWDQKQPNFWPSKKEPKFDKLPWFLCRQQGVSLTTSHPFGLGWMCGFALNMWNSLWLPKFVCITYRLLLDCGHCWYANFCLWNIFGPSAWPLFCMGTLSPFVLTPISYPGWMSGLIIWTSKLSCGTNTISNNSRPRTCKRNWSRPAWDNRRRFLSKMNLGCVYAYSHT